MVNVPEVVRKVVRGVQPGPRSVGFVRRALSVVCSRDCRVRRLTVKTGGGVHPRTCSHRLHKKNNSKKSRTAVFRLVLVCASPQPCSCRVDLAAASGGLQRLLMA